MSSLNPRIHISSPKSPYNRVYDNDYNAIQNRSKNYLNRATDADRDNYLYPGKPESKGRGYKYTFYKDPPNQQNQYYYHSKSSIDLDSFKERDKQPENRDTYYRKQFSPSRSPSFRRNEMRSRQFVDSIDNIIQSHRSKYTHSSLQPPQNYQVESQEILFLKEKLIQTHHKLLKQLQQTNRLGFQLQNAQAECQAQQKQNKKMQFQMDKLNLQIQKLHQQLEQRASKRQQKFRSLQNKAQQQSKRNVQLKDDLQTMRNKMLQTLMLKNNFEQQNTNYKNQLAIMGKNVQKLRLQIRQKDQTIEYLQRELDVSKKKFQRCQKQCYERAQQIHQYNHLATQRQKTINVLQNQLKNQKDKNNNTLGQIKNIQSDHKNVIRKLNQMQELCQKYKGQIYWMQKNKQTNDKILIQKMQKLTQQYNQVNNRLKQKERQLQLLKKRPVYEAQKKKKNYQHTKDFVNRLQTQQNQISMSRTRGYSKGSGRGSSGSKTPQHYSKKTFGNTNSKTPNKRIQSPLSHEPITHKHDQSSYHEQKNKYITMLDQVNQLQAQLLKYNIDKNKMLSQMDRIDDKKVKTKQMITKRRQLQQDLKFQDIKIKNVKQQLKRVKAL